MPTTTNLYHQATPTRSSSFVPFEDIPDDIIKYLESSLRGSGHFDYLLDLFIVLRVYFIACQSGGIKPTGGY